MTSIALATCRLIQFKRTRHSALIPLVAFAFFAGILAAQTQNRSYATEAAWPTRFIAVHGRAALLAGEAAAGIEAWAYPLQIFSGYTPEFRYAGAPTSIPSTALLRRIEYEPTFVERTYIGPDFIVRERLFVPRDLPGAVITYTVDGPKAIAIVVHFKPVLDLMWPVSTGGQQVLWLHEQNAYRLDEPTRRFVALIGSHDATLHDDTPNSNAPLTNNPQLALALRPASNGQSVSVVMACDPANPAATQALYQRLTTGGAELESASEASYRATEAATIQIETPDEDVNRALSYSSIALDQAWVCNPTLGCGLVGGYGPSRGLARRPQYDWFFAGDALVAIRSLVLSGDFARARLAILFLMKHQSATTGMMWHEISQSASYVDWAGSYPYMFPHVDITFDYLSTLQRYVQASGDRQIVLDHWASIQSAYHFCASILDPADGLPRIPIGKEGGDEQGQPREELSLATAWVDAAGSFAQLAEVSGHQELVAPAQQAAQRAAASIPSRFWDAKKNFWIAGFSSKNTPQPQMRSRPLSALLLSIFTPEQTSIVLDTISTSQFQTDWGTRGVSSRSPGYDPASYAGGSVWATSTAEAAAVLWQEQRPLQAWEVWRTLVPWATLDSMGHLHETLSGIFYQPQEESVPEQTWSSAMFLSSFLQGMLGIEQDQTHHRLRLTPHLPAEWDHISIQNLRVGAASVKFSLTRTIEDATSDALDLQIQSTGPSLDLDFTSCVPFGAHILSITVDGRPMAAPANHPANELPARIDLVLTPVVHHVHVVFQDGIEVIVPPEDPVVGDSSHGLRIVREQIDGNSYNLFAEIHRLSGARSDNIVILNTHRHVVSVHGGRLLDQTGNRYRIAIEPMADAPSGSASEYVQDTLQVNFAPSTDMPPSQSGSSPHL